MWNNNDYFSNTHIPVNKLIYTKRCELPMKNYNYIFKPFCCTLFYFLGNLQVINVVKKCH